MVNITNKLVNLVCDDAEQNLDTNHCAMQQACKTRPYNPYKKIQKKLRADTCELTSTNLRLQLSDIGVDPCPSPVLCFLPAANLLPRVYNPSRPVTVLKFPLTSSIRNPHKVTMPPLAR